MIKIGQYNNLEVVKELEFGVYLDGKEEGEILLPLRYVPYDTNIGDIITVFIYYDSEDRIIATTEKPLAQVGEFASLKVKAVNRMGAFLDWGLMKDVLLPFSEQRADAEEGRYQLVFLYVDDKTNRIVATAKLDKFLDNVPPEYEQNEEVELIIWTKTDIGYKVIINELHSGLLYDNEIFAKIWTGKKEKGFIKKIREDDKIDVSLQAQGYDAIEGVAKEIFEKLQDEGGFIGLNDKSSPERISSIFGISKKSFKKAIGTLYKNKLIVIKEDGISVV